MTPMLLLVLVALSSIASAAPIVDAVSQSNADRVAYMEDGTPVDRMEQLLEARNLDDNSLFALAVTHPGLVQQIVENPLLNGEVIRLDSAVRLAPK